MQRRPLNANPDDDPPIDDDAAEDAALYERQAEAHRHAQAAELEASSNGQMTRIQALSMAASLVRGLRARHEPMSKSPRWFRDLTLAEMRAERVRRGLPPLTMQQEDVVEQAAETVHRVAVAEDKRDGRRIVERRRPLSPNAQMAVIA